MSANMLTACGAADRPAAPSLPSPASLREFPVVVPESPWMDRGLVVPPPHPVTHPRMATRRTVIATDEAFMGMGQIKSKSYATSEPP